MLRCPAPCFAASRLKRRAVPSELRRCDGTTDGIKKTFLLGGAPCSLQSRADTSSGCLPRADGTRKMGADMGRGSDDGVELLSRCWRRRRSRSFCEREYPSWSKKGDAVALRFAGPSAGVEDLTCDGPGEMSG